MPDCVAARDVNEQTIVMKKQKPADVIEFELTKDAPSSPAVAAKIAVAESVVMLEPTATLEDMPPIFRELAQPKLPELRHENRARLLMQSPNRLFFYWSVGRNPFQRLNKALGNETASYTLVLKLVDLTRDTEEIHPVEAEGSWWFNVESDSEYRAEIGFYAPNRPYIRALYSNTVTTPRKSPSPRVAVESDWAISSDRFARVLDVAGFTEDAFEVAIAGDDQASAEAVSRSAFAELIGDEDIDLRSIADDELRHAMVLIAAGLALESLRFRISPALFAILQKQADTLDAARATAILKERFDVEADEITEEEFGAAVYASSAVSFPRRLRTRRAPKFAPVSSPAARRRS